VNIKLICGKQEITVSFEEAQRILQVQAGMLGRGSKWHLPEDSNYEFKDNGIIKRANKGSTGKKAASTSTGEGDTSSEKT